MVYLFVGGFLIYYYYGLLQEKKSLTFDYKRLEQEYSLIAKDLAMLKRLQKNSSRVLDLISKNPLIVELLTSIEGILPEGMWIENLQLNDKLVKVSGYAFSESDVVEFARALQKIYVVSTVNMPVTNKMQLKSTGEVVVKFSLSMLISTMGEVIK